MKWDTNRLSAWAKNTKRHHRNRGLPLEVSKKEILRKAKKIIEEDEGRCPICGCKMNQRHADPYQISLDYIAPDEFQIICKSCNEFLGNPEGRIVELGCCSK